MSIYEKVTIRLINAVKSLYERSIGIVRIGSEMSGEFSLDRAIK